MKVAIFDTETTGLPKNSGQALALQPQVIEFYGTAIELTMEENGTVKVDELGELEFLANPGAPLPEIITKITGLSDADLKSAPPFGTYLGDLRRFFSLADCAAAHNLAFDKQLITFEMQRLNTELAWPERLICTVEATVHIKGHRLKLSELYAHLFNETFPGAHRAKADVMALKRVVIELFRLGMM